MIEISWCKNGCCYISVSCPVSSDSQSGSTSSRFTEHLIRTMFPSCPLLTSRGAAHFSESHSYPYRTLTNSTRASCPSSPPWRPCMRHPRPVTSGGAPPTTTTTTTEAARINTGLNPSPRKPCSRAGSECRTTALSPRCCDSPTATAASRVDTPAMGRGRKHPYDLVIGLWRLKLSWGACSGSLDWSDLLRMQPKRKVPSIMEKGCETDGRTDGSTNYSTTSCYVQRTRLNPFCDANILQRFWSTLLTFISMALK